MISPHLNGGQNPNFEGKKFPTYFKILNEPEGGLTKECPTNAKCAVVFETDAENQYFTRPSEPGQFSVIPPETKVAMLLWNGRGVLFLRIPHGISPNIELEVATEVKDIEHPSSLTSKFKLKALEPKAIAKKHRRKKREKKSRKLALPNIVRVHRDRWIDHGFDECSGIKLRSSTFFVNVDNVYLVTEKSRSKLNPQLLEEQYTNGLIIACLAMRQDFNDRVKRGQIKLEEDEIRERIEESSRGLAAVILPILQQLNTLKIQRGALIEAEESRQSVRNS